MFYLGYWWSDKTWRAWGPCRSRRRCPSPWGGRRCRCCMGWWPLRSSPMRACPRWPCAPWPVSGISSSPLSSCHVTKFHKLYSKDFNIISIFGLKWNYWNILKQFTHSVNSISIISDKLYFARTAWYSQSDILPVRWLFQMWFKLSKHIFLQKLHILWKLQTMVSCVMTTLGQLLWRHMAWEPSLWALEIPFVALEQLGDLLSEIMCQSEALTFYCNWGLMCFNLVHYWFWITSSLLVLNQETFQCFNSSKNFKVSLLGMDVQA